MGSSPSHEIDPTQPSLSRALPVNPDRDCKDSGSIAATAVISRRLRFPLHLYTFDTLLLWSTIGVIIKHVSTFSTALDSVVGTNKGFSRRRSQR